MARPKGSFKPIDIDKVERLALIGCTQEEIALVLGCHRSTLLKRKDLHAAYEKGHAHMRETLRRVQFKKAVEGNVTMLIWLGKQVLGQKDRIEETHRAEVIEIERIPAKILE